MANGPLDLESLVDYELRCSRRYNRPVSLVMVDASELAMEDLRGLLGRVIRGSDQFLELGARGVILMGETTREGALSAIRRYKESCGSEIDVRFGVACFPEDASSTEELLTVARRRLDKAVTLEPGAVVAGG